MEDDFYYPRKSSVSAKKIAKNEVIPGQENVKKKVVGGGGIITKYESPFRYIFFYIEKIPSVKPIEF